jgi:hypothetical protein
MESEKNLQNQIYLRLAKEIKMIDREVHLDKSNIIDFVADSGVGIEIKLKGSKKEIFFQCERYASFPAIQQLVLVTNKAMTLPATISGKPCYTINLSKSWL